MNWLKAISPAELRVLPESAGWWWSCVRCTPAYLGWRGSLA